MTEDPREPVVRPGKRYVRLGFLIAAIFLALQAYFYFTSPGYYLAMLRFHGREKSGHQRYYADKLVSLGPKALPVLTEEIFSHKSKRYNPKVYEMLSQIPAGHQHLRQELKGIDGSDANRRKVLLIYALITAYGDWEYLPEFVQAYSELPENAFERITIGIDMTNLIVLNFPDAPLFAGAFSHQVIPEFEDWIEAEPRERFRKHTHLEY